VLIAHSVGFCVDNAVYLSVSRRSGRLARSKSTECDSSSVLCAQCVSWLSTTLRRVLEGSRVVPLSCARLWGCGYPVRNVDWLPVRSVSSAERRGLHRGEPEGRITPATCPLLHRPYHKPNLLFLIRQYRKRREDYSRRQSIRRKRRPSERSHIAPSWLVETTRTRLACHRAIGSSSGSP
jgi:hypothetical protein